MTDRRAQALNAFAILGTVLFLLLAVSDDTEAEIAGSAHDFSALGFANEGACAACHNAHLAFDGNLWSRDLTEERAAFDQDNSPNYIQGSTLFCFDCHDNQNASDVDDDPARIYWGSSVHGGADGYPQDIAFDDYPGGQGSGLTGYYELLDGSLPSGGPTDGSPTGGHYWKSSPDNGGSPNYEQGDKLDCAICHDPHNAVTGSNDVMFRTETSDGTGGTIDLGDGRLASYKTRVNDGKDRQIHNGRSMCASCHRYSDEPNAPGATADGIPTTTVEMWGVPLPQPPTTDPNHAYDANSTVACTTCHNHNKIVAACDDCHGYPPTSANQSYPGGGGAHESHFEGVGRSGLAYIYDFGCLGGACHPADQHPQGNNGDERDVQRANVQVVFDPAWNPDALAYETAGAQTCSQLYCHGNGLTENGELGSDNGTGEGGTSGLGEYAETAAGGKFYGTSPSVQPSWTDTFSGLGIDQCRACHGKGAPDYQLEVNGASPPGVIPQVSPPDYYNNFTQPVQDGNTIYNTTGANTHFIHVYKINSEDTTYGMWGGGVELTADGVEDLLLAGCGCHPLRIQRDPATGYSYHLDRRASLGDALAENESGASNSVGRGCANECHNVPTTADWGDNLTDGSTDNDSCVFVCHGRGNPALASDNYYGGSPGGRITKFAASGGAQDSDDKYMQSGHGLPSGNYASGRPAANLACSDCHLLDDRGGTPATRSYHYERVATATGNPNAPLAPGQPAANPYWLIAPYEADPDGLCETCHDPAVDTDAHNHTAQGMLDHSDHDPNYDTIVAGTWDTYNPNCIHCHDPHGESNWFMLYDSFPEKSAHDGDSMFSGPVIYDGSRFGVTVVGAAPGGHGFPPTPYAANQTAVTMLDNTSGSDYAVGDGSGICEVCHTLTDFYRSDGSAPGGNHPITLCTDCHKHMDSFAPSACEGCHNGDVRFDPDGIGSDPPAPNVMGDGVSITGAGGVVDDDGNTLGPQPYDDGTWGFNVNGHGAMNYDAQSRTVQCPDCHDIQSHHTNGDLNTLDWPGKVGTTRMPNTSHLVAGFLPGGTPQARQVAFDDYCTDTCHTDAREMRHSAPAAPSNPSYDGVMEFGQASSEANPKIVRSGWTLWGDDVLTATNGAAPGIDDEKYTPGVGPGGGDPATSYWFPWTISDLTNSAAAPPYYGTCVSCHDPHGVPTSDQSRGLNHMVRFNWKTPPSSDKNFSCNSMCHGSKP